MSATLFQHYDSRIRVKLEKHLREHDDHDAASPDARARTHRIRR